MPDSTQNVVACHAYVQPNVELKMYASFGILNIAYFLTDNTCSHFKYYLSYLNSLFYFLSQIAAVGVNCTSPWFVTVCIEVVNNFC